MLRIIALVCAGFLSASCATFEEPIPVHFEKTDTGSVQTVVNSSTWTNREKTAFAVSIGCMLLDLGTTEYGLAHGHTESNKLMRDRSARIVGKLVLAGFTWVIPNQYPGDQAVIPVAISVLECGLGIWNLNVILN